MHIADLIEVVCAVHLSSYVESPFPERGGLMLVGAPGTLKSTIVMVLEQQYSDAVALSDINAQGLVTLRDAIATGSIRTLVLPELQKLYERHPQTASNVEGTLRAIAGEGFQSASFEDQRINSLKARATVIAALTPETQRKHFTEWESLGFNRRFLWPLIRLRDPGALERAIIEKWQRLSLSLPTVPRVPLNGVIPNVTTVEDRRHVARLVKYQPGGSHVLQVQLMTKVLSVLAWWYKETGQKRNAVHTLDSFAEALGREGAEIDVGMVRPTTRRKVPRISPHKAGQTLAQRRWQQQEKKK